MPLYYLKSDEVWTLVNQEWQTSCQSTLTEILKYLGYHFGTLPLCVSGEGIFPEMCVAGSDGGVSSSAAQIDGGVSWGM